MLHRLPLAWLHDPMMLMYRALSVLIDVNLAVKGIVIDIIRQ